MFEGRIMPDGERSLYFNGVLQLPRTESPFGEMISWGHNGRASAQTAYLILRRYCRAIPSLEQVHRFKREVIAQQFFDRDFMLDKAMLAGWINSDRAEQQAA